MCSWKETSKSDNTSIYLKICLYCCLDFMGKSNRLEEIRFYKKYKKGALYYHI